MPRAGAAATIEALVIELDRPGPPSDLVEEFHSLHSREVLRVIDVVVVRRDAHGAVEARGQTELSTEEADEVKHAATDALGFEVGGHQFGGVHWEGTSVLLGDEDVRFIAGMLKPGQAAMAVVFEHRWAQRLDGLLHERGVRIVEDDVYTPQDVGQSPRGAPPV